MRDPTQTAIRLIARDRAARLSLVDVGRESGYSHALPNFYFKNKRLLLLEVYAHIVNSAKANIARWARDNVQGGVTPGLQNVFATIRGYLNLAVEDPMSTRALHKLRFESVSSMPQLLEAVQPWSRRFVSELLRAAAGERHPTRRGGCIGGCDADHADDHQHAERGSCAVVGGPVTADAARPR